MSFKLDRMLVLAAAQRDRAALASTNRPSTRRVAPSII
jgi:hypothetical protein